MPEEVGAGEIVPEEIEVDGYEQVVSWHDPDSGLRAIIAIHDSTLGPALGGVRMAPYPSEEAALQDVLRLSRGMTYKAALAGVDLGGGKSVIIGDPQRDKSEALLRAMGRFVQSLQGRYIPGIDSGTTQDDLRTVALEADRVSCIGADPSPLTALGVYAAVVAGVHRVYGSPDLAGRRVAVQGVGHVGSALARLLAKDGAELVVGDVRNDIAQALGTELDATVVEPEEVPAVPCDVFAPCALGGVIDDHVLEMLDTRVVAGAANNQLLTPEHGAELYGRGVLYAPDYCANGGGIIFLTEEMAGHDIPVAERRVMGISATVERIWERSQHEDVPPEVIADTMAEERIAAGRRA